MRAAYSKIWYNLSVDSERGMTLLEVLLVSAVFSVIFAAVLNFYSGGLRSWSKGLTALDLQQNARIALYEITQELRYAAGIEGFEDEDIIPVCRNDEQPGQGSSRLIYTSVEGRQCEIYFDKAKRIITVKKANGPRIEIACQVSQLDFFRYLPEMPETDNPPEGKGISPMILVILGTRENCKGEDRGNPYFLQSKIRLLNIPR
jgi:prepilin-type N-terminal cleavage/methylation domain-containing protein